MRILVAIYFCCLGFLATFFISVFYNQIPGSGGGYYALFIHAPIGALIGALLGAIVGGFTKDIANKESFNKNGAVLGGFLTFVAVQFLIGFPFVGTFIALVCAPIGAYIGSRANLAKKKVDRSQQ